jgi:hypothetical protein
MADMATFSNVSVGVLRTGAQTSVIPRVALIIYEDIGAEGASARILTAVETPTSRLEISDPADIKDYEDHLTRTAPGC